MYDNIVMEKHGKPETENNHTKLDTFVLWLDSGSQKIYSFLFEWSFEGIRKKPRNLHFFLILFSVFSLGYLIFAGSLFPRLDWKPTKAFLSYLKIEQIDISTANPRGPYDYRAKILYRYRFDGRLYSGTEIVPGVEQVFNKREDIERILGGTDTGREISIYVNPNHPRQSGVLAGPMSVEIFSYLFGGFLVYILVLVGLAKYLHLI